MEVPNFINILLLALAAAVFIYAFFIFDRSKPLQYLPVFGNKNIVLKDGKATDRWGFGEEMKMMTQMGMMPAPGAPADSTKKM